jgi:hypothetical protein
MTCIVTGFPTKKALREALAAGRTAYITNPSVFPPSRFEHEGWTDSIPLGKTVIVTNHPKRSWFAQITRTEKGLKVT